MRKYSSGLIVIAMLLFIIEIPVVNSEANISEFEPNDVEESYLDVKESDSTKENEEDVNDVNDSEVMTKTDSTEDFSDESLDDSKGESTKGETFQLRTTSTPSDIVLTNGSKNNQVVELKLMLKKVGIGNYPDNPSKNFGSSTTRNVKKFQSYFPELRQDGVVDTKTWNKLNSIVNSKYQKGKKGSHVVELKLMLKDLGIGNYPANPSGNYGSSTERNVRTFQQQNKLLPSGIADENTIKLLKQLTSNTNKLPYKNGDKHAGVVELKLMLKKVGIGNYPDNPSKSFGSSTTRNVKKFQSYFPELRQDGVVDTKTWNKLNSIVNSKYQKGKKGSHVVELKLMLKDLGIGNYPANPSGNYGSSTERNVRTFQQQNNLLPSGIADESTIAKMKRILSLPYKQGDRHNNIVKLKKMLTFAGIGNYPSNPSNYFGSSTTKNVKKFQSYYKDLRKDGVVDEATWKKLIDIHTSPYVQGAKGNHVVELKKKLSKIGFGNYSENVSNTYDSLTKKDVQTFQKYYGLMPHGIVDSYTMKEIDKIVDSDYQNGKNGPHVVELKLALSKIGIGNYPANPSGSYGKSTENNVRKFQSYYGLIENGIADEVTLKKINEILKSPYQRGKSGNHVVQLKKKLKRLGIGNYPANPSGSYGKSTENNVRKFQSYYGLIENGIADEVTLKKIDEILKSPYQRGKSGNHVVQLKKDLSKLGIGNYPAKPSPNYGSSTERNVKIFQETYGLLVNGIADEVTLDKIKSLLKGNTFIKYNVALKEAVEIQMKASPQTDKREYAWVSKNYIDSNYRVTAETLNVRTQPTTKSSHENRILGTLSKGDKVDVIDEVNGWYAIKYSSTGYNWFHATRNDVQYYLNPNNFVNHERYRYQFLDLSRPSGATRSQLNNFLKGKGVLEGQGQAFIDAARLHRVNDVYLISHALLETGHGTSTLAKGVRVGLNAKGEPKRVTSANEKSLTKIKTVYNVYGIGAYDSCPVDCGAVRAYSEGWDSVDKAIIGGAQFIGSSYIHAGQNTLYKMRWNPVAMEKLGYASHQYATDVGWAAKQVNSMYNLYQEIGISHLVLEIPVYK